MSENKEPQVKIIRSLEKNINMVKSIYIGDPWYIEQYDNNEMDLKKLNSIALLRNFRGKRDWVGSLKLSEILLTYEDGTEIRDFEININFAPTEEYLKTYNKGMYFTTQKQNCSFIGVDTAKYTFGIDDREITIRTGGDGSYGDVTELTRYNKCQGFMINLYTGDLIEWEEIKDNLEYLFEIKFEDDKQ